MRLYHLFIALALLIAALVQTAVGSPIDKLAIERALDLNDRDYDLDLDLELGHDREKRGRLASLFSSSSASPSPSSDPGPRRPSKPTLHLALAMTGDPGPCSYHWEFVAVDSKKVTLYHAVNPEIGGKVRDTTKWKYETKTAPYRRTTSTVGYIELGQIASAKAVTAVMDKYGRQVPARAEGYVLLDPKALKKSTKVSGEKATWAHIYSKAVQFGHDVKFGTYAEVGDDLSKFLEVYHLDTDTVSRIGKFK